MLKSLVRQKISSTIGYFIRGLVFIAPIMITYAIINGVFDTLNRILPLPYGLGILVMLCTITIFGYFGSKLFFQPIFEWFENLLEKRQGSNLFIAALKICCKLLLVKRNDLMNRYL